jgi:hypothetical protein
LTLYVSNFAILNHRKRGIHRIVVTWRAVAFSAGGDGDERSLPEHPAVLSIAPRRLRQPAIAEQSLFMSRQNENGILEQIPVEFTYNLRA